MNNKIDQKLIQKFIECAECSAKDKLARNILALLKTSFGEDYNRQYELAEKFFKDEKYNIAAISERIFEIGEVEEIP